MKGSAKKARQRAEIIMKVQSGQMTASDAAKELGVSRKTYYKWENRGLQALLDAVSDREPGRPAQPVDTEKEAMERSMEEMEKQLLLAEQRAEIRDYYLTGEELDTLDRMSEMVKKKLAAKTDRKSDGEPEDQ